MTSCKRLWKTLGQQQREAKAERAQDLAVAFVYNFSSAVGQELCTVYMHFGMCHLPDMIRRLPLNTSDVFQQWFEALLKQGKTDARLFSNKRLRDEKQAKGRNYQVLGKERERVRMKRDVPMPLNRNEKRHLGGYKASKRAAKQTVERAVRRGQLSGGVAKSKLELDARVTKQESGLTAIVARFKGIRAATADANRAAAREWGASHQPGGGFFNTAASTSSIGRGLLPAATGAGPGGAAAGPTGPGGVAAGPGGAGAGPGV
jgi:hypothetical protein